MSVWNDITSQVDNLRQVIETHAASSQREMQRAAGLLKSANSITYAGVGSGLNATIPACVYLMAEGIPSQYLDATELTYDLFPGVKSSALVLNTRSGETIDLIKLAKMAREARIPTVAVTNEPGSTVGRLADICIPTHSRWDELVVLSAYGGMLATELILASFVADQVAPMLEALHSAAHAMQAVFDQAMGNRAKARELFGTGHPVYLLGRGASFASALAGTLVLQEMARQAAIPMAGGLFRQGPIEVVDDRFAAFIFEGAGQVSPLNISLARDLVSAGGQVYWIGAASIAGALSLQLPRLPACVLPLLEVIPLHLLAYDLAEKQGYQPGAVRYIQKVITTETGLPNQEAAS